MTLYVYLYILIVSSSQKNYIFPKCYLHFDNSLSASMHRGHGEINIRIFDPNMMNHAITFYHFPLSPPSRAALLVVKALGIKHNLKIIDIMKGEQNTPDFLTMNPLHTVPTVDDGGCHLYDSSIIMKYLSNMYAKDDGLFPKDPTKAAIVEMRMYFCSEYLFKYLREYFRPIMFENNQPSTEKAKKFEDQMLLLDSFLEDEMWLAGKDLTLCDFYAIAIVSTAEAIMFQINKYPNVSSWYDRAKKVMIPLGYEEVNQSGVDQFGKYFRTALKQWT